MSFSCQGSRSDRQIIVSRLAVRVPTLTYYNLILILILKGNNIIFLIQQI